MPNFKRKLYSTAYAFITLGFYLIISTVNAMADEIIDGVPLPDNALHEVGKSVSGFFGIWIGAWDGSLKHILIVKQSNHNTVEVIYAYSDHSRGAFKKKWHRPKARINNDALEIIFGEKTTRYHLTKNDRLSGVFSDGFSHITMKRTTSNWLKTNSNNINWLTGETIALETTLGEADSPVRLETLLFKPAGEGPHPLVVINHGSTGEGTDETSMKETWLNVRLAEFFNELGWAVAFPQRRGRGNSDGLYDEGFHKDRSKGYTCDYNTTLKGTERAIQDLDAAIQALRKRPDIKSGKVLLAGQSRGGILSATYAGKNPQEVTGVINFVGGWLGEGCASAEAVNGKLFQDSATFPNPMLWLYGKQDYFYSIQHSKNNFKIFKKSGGKGKFVAVNVPGKNLGHFAISRPELWQTELETYLKQITR